MGHCDQYTLSSLITYKRTHQTDLQDELRIKNSSGLSSRSFVVCFLHIRFIKVIKSVLIVIVFGRFCEKFSYGNEKNFLEHAFNENSSNHSDQYIKNSIRTLAACNMVYGQILPECESLLEFEKTKRLTSEAYRLVP